MEKASESTMEEILASIRKIIASDPKGAAKAFTETNTQMYSEAKSVPASSPTAQDKSPAWSDFTKGQQKIRVEPTFSSPVFASSTSVHTPLSSSSSHPSFHSPETERSKKLTAAVDRDLAGLFEINPSPAPVKDPLETPSTVEKWSSGFATYSNLPNNASASFIPHTNVSTAPMPQEHPQAEGTPSEVYNPAPVLENPYSRSAMPENNSPQNTFLTASGSSYLEGSGSYQDPVKEKDETSFSPADVKMSSQEVASEAVSGEHPPTQAILNSDESTRINSEQSDNADTSVNVQNTSALETHLINAEKTIPNSMSTQVSQRTLEDVVSDLLRPMLQQWVETHLPQLAPQLLKRENT